MLDLELLRPAIEAGWGVDTCDPHDLPEWRADNPARGQCGVTALIVQDLLGGELIVGEVQVEAAKVGHHYWNRLPDGQDVDLTAGQFHPSEVVVGGQVQQRPPGPPRRCREQYELLRHRVLSVIGDGAGPSPEDGGPLHVDTPAAV
ncbi:YunG family protein [Actinoplanes derwentensis]|uniref:Uncharacterized protein n=1 Tax=Actinoplanes derwentensis TaxID=113562 RepID=A0A1H1YTI6_9ACTN|nr:hypothetical protein [Actinoplanes derwentensis]GID81283.1 hypothetical protein Ade03nite_02070 [Actinoplanes derwentensis]SDT24727.1 hypothetical protein SAMN04489716_2991 [Actinoplanes derwentensis]